MSGKEEWGPWIEHDGKGCPVPNGAAYHAIFDDGDEEFGVRGNAAFVVGEPESYDSSDGSWWWDGDYFRVIQYRIRKPRALMDLIELVENLPAPVGPKVDA